MNVIWALKWRMRGDRAKADSYLQSAWTKVQAQPPMGASDGIAQVLDLLAQRADADPVLLERTREAALAATA